LCNGKRKSIDASKIASPAGQQLATRISATFIRA